MGRTDRQGSIYHQIRKEIIMKYPPILDACCGGKMFYFDKHDNRVLFQDIREVETTLCDGRHFEVKPDLMWWLTLLICHTLMALSVWLSMTRHTYCETWGNQNLLICMAV